MVDVLMDDEGNIQFESAGRSFVMNEIMSTGKESEAKIVEANMRKVGVK